MSESDQVYLVVGGEGFLGRKIVEALVKQRKSVCGTYEPSDIRVVDVKKNYEVSKDDYVFFEGDICNKDSLIKILNHNGKPVTTVFHTASPIMKAPASLHKKVNVLGTRALLDACKTSKVQNFIYTSSASVVYSGKPLIYVDETIPYAEPFADYYSETKAIAEKMCLDENNFADGGMKTVSLRPSGIFGPGDNQTTPGALTAQKKGYPVLFQIGDNTALFDFTYVDNLVDAHLAASNALIKSQSDQSKIQKIGGNSFFITNDEPIGMWSFLRLLWAQVGDVREPKIIIPNWLAGIILVILKFLSSIHIVKHEVPFVFGMTFTNRFFCIDKAKNLLGYKPKVSYKEGAPLAVSSTLKRWKDEESRP
ncbi:Sterol-4-alpha-carboxylate 3-dehydrogenase, decarboxylating [Smittium mucronatum]|uniref:Sterol-4-alpha-carboxylate 3-dehydrogenase, decarboxylating n=1 Tax=Smittium mucronatum TaxID=133383 RepID=A0A1R0GV08_9FUNG|nr:Sterol-4-alpha-carboxylate 3-dehydrogenase, decarboxylating [Smittium mucronatum]